MAMQFVERTPPEGGAQQEVLCVSDASIRLTPILILDDSMMMFSVWCQAASGTTIQIIGGNTQAEMVVSTGWKRAVVQMEDVEDVFIMVPAGTTVYFYKAQLEAGTKASDWKPAPRIPKNRSMESRSAGGIYTRERSISTAKIGRTGHS